MSAYMVSRTHIDYLIQAGLSRVLRPGNSGPLRWWHGENSHYLTDENATDAGQMLWDANMLSINARYPDTLGHPEKAPGPIGENFSGYKFHYDPCRSIVPVNVIKAADGLDYQACEYDGWPESEAKALLNAIREAAIHALPGYDEAPWEVTEARKRIASWPPPRRSCGASRR